MEKKFDYDSSSDVVPIGVINETKKLEKAPMPYTLAKAKEKEDAKLKSMNNRSMNSSNKAKSCTSMSSKDALLKVGMHKLPKDILDQLGISNILLANYSSDNQNSSITTATNKTPAISDEKLSSIRRMNGDEKMESSKGDGEEGDGLSSKPRKVSFKDTPELISPTVKESNENQPLASSTVSEKCN